MIRRRLAASLVVALVGSGVVLLLLVFLAHRSPRVQERDPAVVVAQAGPWAATVDGDGIPLATYERQAALFRHLYDGPPAKPGTPAARTITLRIEDKAIDAAIREYLILRAARRAHVTAPRGQVQEMLRQIIQAAGGAGKVQARWGLKAADVQQIATVEVLDELLAGQRGDRHWLDRETRGALIVYDVGSRVGANAATVPAAMVGHPAPGFVARDMAGKTVALGDLAGHPVVLTLWKRACLWCGDDFAILQDFARRHGAVRVVAIDEGDSLARVRAYLHGTALAFALWLDEDNTAQELYAPTGYPATYLIGADGVVRDMVIGPLVDRQNLESRTAVLGPAGR